MMRFLIALAFLATPAAAQTIVVPAGETLTITSDTTADAIEVFGTLNIGTLDDPADLTITFTTGPIDTAAYPMLTGRGLICHGTCRIFGQPKTTHGKVLTDPVAGDTFVVMAEPPIGWEPGDRIVIAGTRYDGWKRDLGTERYHHPPEDEVRIITAVSGAEVFFSDPLVHDHTTPRPDLKTSVGNYSRSVTFRSPEGIPISERAHAMFMGETEVRYAAFENMGRTDKSYQGREASAFDTIEPDTNVKGRYPLHLHRGATYSVLIGNAVWGSPGWGIVQHDTDATINWNVTYDTYGAGFAAESGNETGIWEHNLAIYAKGRSWSDPKDANNEGDPYFDLGHSGDGFWLQGRMIELRHNIAASVNTGFVYFHRGPTGEGFKLPFDASVWEFPWALGMDPTSEPNNPSIRHFEDNEVFAARGGIQVSKGSPRQRHDVHTVLRRFTAWNVIVGADMRYTSHYSMIDFDLIGRTPTDKYNEPEIGARIGVSAFDMNWIRPKIHNFKIGAAGARELRGVLEGEPLSYRFVAPQITNSQTYFNETHVPYSGVLPEEVQAGLRAGPFALHIPARPVFGSAQGQNSVEPYGAKIDSVGVIEFPTGPDTLGWDVWSVLRWLQSPDGGYWSRGGENVMLLPIHATDRGTGEVHLTQLEVLILPDVDLSAAVYRGELPASGDPSADQVAALQAELAAKEAENAALVADLNAALSTAADLEARISEAVTALTGP